MNSSFLSSADFLQSYKSPEAHQAGLQQPDYTRLDEVQIDTIYEPGNLGEFIKPPQDIIDYSEQRSEGKIANVIPYNRLCLKDKSIFIFLNSIMYKKYVANIYSIYEIGATRFLADFKPRLLILDEKEGPMFLLDKPAFFVNDAIINRLLSNAYDSYSLGIKNSYTGPRRPDKVSEPIEPEYLVPDIKEGTQTEVLQAVVEYLRAEQKGIFTEIEEYKEPGYKRVNKIHLEVCGYDFLFQQLDMILTLIVRGVALPNPLGRVSLHYLYIRNLYKPDSLGDYVRQPVSLFFNTLQIISGIWNGFMQLGSLYIYQESRNVFSKQKIGPVSLGRNPVQLENLYRIPAINIMNLKIMDGPISQLKESRRQLSHTLPNVEFSENYNRHAEIMNYVPTLRNERLLNAMLEYWNLERWYVPDFKNEYAEQMIRQMAGGQYVRGNMIRQINAKDYIRDDTNEGDYIYEDYRVRSKDTIYQDIDEEFALDTSLKQSKVNINGVEFKSEDIKLLYNTHLFDLIKMSDESNFDLPGVSLKDLRLLRDAFEGRISLLYMYENISDYMYAQISNERSMMDIFEFLPARYFILSAYSLGLPLRQQLLQVKYEDLGTIGRLDELIAIAR